MASIRSPAHQARNDQFRSMFASLKDAKALIPPTASTVSSRVEALGTSYQVEDVPNSQGARLHYIGDLGAAKVILYFHGGGYALGPTEGHVNFTLQCAETILQKSGNKPQVCFLEYSLSDKAKHPVQLKQAVEACRYLIDSGKRPSDIIVAGDSAGGHMCLALASHILHPLDQVKPLVLSERLAGMLLLSPLVCFDQDTPSYKENAGLDICSAELLKDMGDAWIPATRNNYTDPYFAPATWWKGFPVTKVLNLYGGHELLKDHVAAIGKTLVAAGVDVKTVECPLHVHVECILDCQSGLEHGVMANETWAWLGNVFH